MSSEHAHIPWTYRSCPPWSACSLHCHCHFWDETRQAINSRRGWGHSASHLAVIHLTHLCWIDLTYIYIHTHILIRDPIYSGIPENLEGFCFFCDGGYISVPCSSFPQPRMDDVWSCYGWAGTSNVQRRSHTTPSVPACLRAWGLSCSVEKTRLPALWKLGVTLNPIVRPCNFKKKLILWAKCP